MNPDQNGLHAQFEVDVMKFRQIMRAGGFLLFPVDSPILGVAWESLPQLHNGNIIPLFTGGQRGFSIELCGYFMHPANGFRFEERGMMHAVYHDATSEMPLIVYSSIADGRIPAQRSVLIRGFTEALETAASTTKK